MAYNLHLICKDGMNHRHLGNGEHETGEWVLGDDAASQVVKVFLHDTQATRAWHGGEVLEWRPGEIDPARKVFKYRATAERPVCREHWGREKALVEVNPEN